MKTRSFSTASAWARAEESRTVTLRVEGMGRMVDVAAVTAVLGEHAGVIDVRIDIERCHAIVMADPALATGEMLAQAVTEAGYPAAPIA